MKIVKVEAIPVRQKGEIKEINDSAQDGVIVRVTTDEESSATARWSPRRG